METGALPRHTRERLCSHSVDALIRVWSDFDFDLDHYPVPPESVFDGQTISEIIMFLIDWGIHPGNMGELMRLERMGRGDPLPELLANTGLITPMFCNGPEFTRCSVQILLQGIRGWVAVLAQHGILVEHIPQRGAPVTGRRHWEWCEAVVGEWRRDEGLRTTWVMQQIMGMGPRVDDEVQRRRGRRMEELFEVIERAGGANLLVAEPHEVDPALLPVIREYLRLLQGRPWNPPAGQAGPRHSPRPLRPSPRPHPRPPAPPPPAPPPPPPARGGSDSPNRLPTPASTERGSSRGRSRSRSPSRGRGRYRGRGRGGQGAQGGPGGTGGQGGQGIRGDLHGDDEEEVDMAYARATERVQRRMTRHTEAKFYYQSLSDEITRHMQQMRVGAQGLRQRMGEDYE